MKKIIFVLSLSFILVFSSNIILGYNEKSKSLIKSFDDIDDYIINEMQIKHIPGLSACFVINETVRWQNSYGYADIQNDTLVKNETLFKIASVSKTITATALMQLYEQNYFDLNDPINDYLPYNVIHPDYPDIDITFHMLLTHSSGINDNWNYLFYFQGDSPIPFQTFLEEYLVPGGLYYNADDNFCPWEPGSSWKYTNIGVALIGYLVEVISNMNFTSYCQSQLFQLLDMNESGWFLRDLNVSHIAMPYSWNGFEYIPYGHIGYVDVPAGDLRTSSKQLINFLTMYINNGSFNSNILLNPSTVEMMLTPQLPFNQNLGLIWWKSNIGGRIVWGHGGSDFGARALMQFDPTTKIGVVILINGEATITNIADVLFAYAETLLDNLPPEKPTKPTGPTNGLINIEYFYNTTTIDMEDNEIFYMWDWGDGTFSDWLGPYNSDEICTASHIWDEKGVYEIKVKAKDIESGESEWSDPLPVTMPKNIINNINLFQCLNKRFTYFFTLIKHFINVEYYLI